MLGPVPAGRRTGHFQGTSWTARYTVSHSASVGTDLGSTHPECRSRPSKIYPLVHELAADRFPVAVTCRVLSVSRSGFYDWSTRPASAQAQADVVLSAVIVEIHLGSRRSYGAPRVHAELRMAREIRCGRKRVARLMRAAAIAGICHRRKRRGQRPVPAPHEDLVQRRFVADALTGCGPPTSPSTPRRTGRSTAARSSTPTRA